MERWIRIIDEQDEGRCEWPPYNSMGESCSKKGTWIIRTDAGSAKCCDNHCEPFSRHFYKLAEIKAGMA